MHPVAQALLEIGAVGFSFDSPITFASGIKSPVYVDNRRLPYHPQQWQVVMAALKDQLAALEKPEVIASVATGGISHGSVLGYETGTPSVYIRKEAKKYGKTNQIEGGEVAGKQVVLIEDMVTTGGSSLKAIEVLKEAGAQVDDCVVIVTYGFEESNNAFAGAGVRLHATVTFPEILSAAQEMGKITIEQAEIVENWLKDLWKYE